METHDEKPHDEKPYTHNHIQKYVEGRTIINVEVESQCWTANDCDIFCSHSDFPANFTLDIRKSL